MQVYLWLLSCTLCNVRDNISGRSWGGSWAPILLDQTEAWDSCRTSSAGAPRAEKNIFLRLDPPYMSGSGWPAFPPPPPPLIWRSGLATEYCYCYFQVKGRGSLNWTRMVKETYTWCRLHNVFLQLMLMLMQFYRLVVPSSTRCLASQCSGLNSIRWSLLPYYQDHWDKPCSSVWYCHSI